jgi:hypothetical protein
MSVANSNSILGKKIKKPPYLLLSCHDVPAGEEEGEGERVVVLHLQHFLLATRVHQPERNSHSNALNSDPPGTGRVVGI